MRERSFTLASGTRAGSLDESGRPRIWSVFLNSTQYADLTGDGQEEAIASLYLLPDNTSTAYGYYVFGMRDRQPRLLWSFLTKDRGVGGLRRVFVENGQIVVELLGADQTPAHKVVPSGEPAGEPPDVFTRARYQWTGGRFDMVGKEVLGLTAGRAGGG